MERNAPGVIFYDSYFEDFELLSDKEIATVLRAIRQYSLEGDVNIELNRCCRAVFNGIRRNMDADNLRYEKRYNANIANGKKGGRPKRDLREENVGNICDDTVSDDTLNKAEEYEKNTDVDDINDAFDFEYENDVSDIDNKTEITQENPIKPKKPNNNININSNINKNENINTNSNDNTNENTNQTQNENVIPYNPPEAPKGDDSSLIKMFDTFWESYPRKTSKKAALKIFIRLNPDSALFRQMMDALSEQKKTSQWRTVKFIPHASTWLFGRRWEDEITPDDEAFFGRIDTTPTNISELDQYF